MENGFLVSSCLKREGLYPEGESAGGGLRLRLDGGRLLLGGPPEDLIGLADLLVSLALSGENRGQHWHVDDLTLMDEASEIPEMILLRE